MTAVHDVVGYVVCATCDDVLVLDAVAKRTGGLCVDCMIEAGGPRRDIEIVARGARIPIPLEPRRPQKRSKSTKESKARDRAVERCKDRARKRLQALFPDLYDILLAEERAAAGFDPFPLSAALRYGPDPDASRTDDFLAVYHLLEERGVDV